MTRKAFFLTGIRSEYDILASVIEAVDRIDGLQAGVIVTGAHLSKEHGLSVRQIEADGFRIVARIDSLLKVDTLAARVKGAGLQLMGLSDVLDRGRPDLLVVMGDREESITGALTAAYLRIPVVHIGGGDHADDGNVDNLVRHAVTKLSSLHMVATPRSGERVRALGEEPWRVHVVGAPGLDRLAETPSMTRAELFHDLGVDWSDEFAVVLFHPTIRDFGEASANMEVVLRAVERAGLPMAIIHPNSDPGSRGVVDAIEGFVARHGRARSFAYLPRVTFVNLLRQARVLVGNSSAGIIEAPFLKLPAVNIGIRQTGREHGDNVVFVGYDMDAIVEAVRRAASDTAFRQRTAAGANPYGDGRAGARIAAILRDVELGERLATKPFLEGSGR